MEFLIDSGAKIDLPTNVSYQISEKRQVLGVKSYAKPSDVNALATLFKTEITEVSDAHTLHPTYTCIIHVQLGLTLWSVLSVEQVILP